MSLLPIEGHWSAVPAYRRWPLLAVLAALHVALALLVAQQLAQRQPPGDKPRPLWARLTLWLRPVPSEATALPAKQPRLAPPAPAPRAMTQDPIPNAEASAPTPAATTPAEPTSAAAPQGGSEVSATPRAPLRIILPKPGKPGEFTPLHNPALSDPRSNTKLRLTVEEKMAVALGTVECILEERQPDGTIWRGGGRLITVPSAIANTGAAAAGSGPNAVVRQCVR